MGRDQRGTVAILAGLLLIERSRGVLLLLHRPGAARRKIAVARGVGTREADGGLVGMQGRLRLCDERGMLRNLRIEITHRCHRYRQVALRAGKSGTIVPVVDAGQKLARFYHLIIVDQDFCNLAGHTRRDERVIGADIGVIRRLGARLGKQLCATPATTG